VNIMAVSQRLLDPAMLPPCLWERTSETLVLPKALAAAYEVVIDRCGLRELALSRDQDNPPVGGISQEQTDKHFAQAFDGSVARTQLALLDPGNKAVRASNSFIRSLAGNRVALIDAPCGAGAAALAFLANIAVLREHDVLPREPLDIHLIGAEISEPARNYANDLLFELRTSLEAQAVFVESEFIAWDATDTMSTTDLVKRMTVAAANCDKTFLVIANFNAFLIRDGEFKKAQPKIAELLRYCSGESSAAIWIEPDMNRATEKGGLFPNVRAFLRGAWRFFAREDTEDALPAPISTASARFRLPLNPSQTARVGLAVMPLDLIRTP
jgi:hypothetical protein